MSGDLRNDRLARLWSDTPRAPIGRERVARLRGEVRRSFGELIPDGLSASATFASRHREALSTAHRQRNVIAKSAIECLVSPRAWFAEPLPPSFHSLHRARFVVPTPTSIAPQFMWREHYDESAKRSKPSAVRVAQHRGGSALLELLEGWGEGSARRVVVVRDTRQHSPARFTHLRGAVGASLVPKMLRRQKGRLVEAYQRGRRALTPASPAALPLGARGQGCTAFEAVSAEPP